MDRCVDQLGRFVGTEVERAETVNCHHNYTERETHFGREVWLSRKGAISAREGQPGLIPGSMGTASYVVVGKGNVPSLMSSPHGAGRNHSRTAARRLFSRADLDARMAGIAWGHSDAFLDEHPDAYKADRPCHGRRGRSGRGAAHPASDRQRQGRLTAVAGAPPGAPATARVSGTPPFDSHQQGQTSLRSAPSR